MSTSPEPCEVATRHETSRPVVIIVAYRSSVHLPACLEALAAAEADPTPVIVVDNACPERSGHASAPHPSVVAVVTCDRNRGFADGVNRGISEAWRLGFREFVVLNPDARPRVGWLSALARTAGAASGAGILGALLVDEDGETIEAMQSAMLARYLGSPPRRTSDLSSDAISVVSVIGAAMWIRSDVVEAIGGMDPLFFLYAEEIDYCQRASAVGFEILLVPESVVAHLPGGSQPSRGDRWKSAWLRVRNQTLLFLKRPRVRLSICLLDLPVFLSRRIVGDTRSGQLTSALLRVATLPAVFLRLASVARSRAEESAGPAHLSLPLDAE